MTTWSDRIAVVLSAARTAGCTESERDHALVLLSRWQTPARALDYVRRVDHRYPLPAGYTCPYVGEL
jgi:hypothetical protein